MTALEPRGSIYQNNSASLADILERVLDKGIVIAGDVQVNLLDIELLTLKLRLLIASADTARSMGIDWWEHDPALSSRARDRELEKENSELRERLDRLERAIEGNGR
jgi:gas vesicle protein GvpA/GvpJ/GvpM family